MSSGPELSSNDLGGDRLPNDWGSVSVARETQPFLLVRRVSFSL